MQYDGKYQFGWRAKTDLRNNPNMTDAEIAKLLQMDPKEYKKLSDEEKGCSRSSNANFTCSF